MIQQRIKQKIYRLYSKFIPLAQIKQQLGIEGWMLRIAVRDWPELRAERARHFSRLSKQSTRKLKEEPMGQSYESQMRALQLEGYKKLHTDVRCPKCRTMNRIMRKDGSMCKHCGDKQDKTVKRVLTGILGLVLMCCVGCASAPSKATIQVRVAGQEVNVCFNK